MDPNNFESQTQDIRRELAYLSGKLDGANLIQRIDALETELRSLRSFAQAATGAITVCGIVIVLVFGASAAQMPREILDKTKKEIGTDTIETAKRDAEMALKAIKGIREDATKALSDMENGKVAKLEELQLANENGDFVQLTASSIQQLERLKFLSNHLGELPDDGKKRLHLKTDYLMFDKNTSLGIQARHPHDDPKAGKTRRFRIQTTNAAFDFWNTIDPGHGFHLVEGNGADTVQRVTKTGVVKK
ncbi:hypothetical protein AB1L30_05255 [Bremerella sp. JC817]|uniref:hypothetical protein n=1 Tax=Bremerella sp. JC817 TaxID=3231756 RepID=UPI003457E32B